MTDFEILDAGLLARFPLPHHPEDSGKEDRGRLLVVAGSRELPGAALLAGVGALRAGAGKLQIATARSVAVQLGIAVPEARVIGHDETEDGCIAEEGIAPLVGWAEKAQAVMVGCGLRQGPPLEKLLDALLGCGAEIPLVLDAAALGCLDKRVEAARARRGGTVVLPHAGEAAGLLGTTREAVEADPLAAARTASERFGAVAVIKGRYSFIVAPDGRAFRFEGGGVGLATSGSGDALAGIVGGLCARGADPLTAALWGVWLHGEAGRRLSRQVGRVGFLARELLDEVPRLLEGG
ncbi:MAG: NAD(P)H-hydrate dehydratase [Allosphingosinicella sp.]|uniref:NAD(P)H-hydrate dehydratase n=1 Tax=Allosphingosinicella sp. TaxID=2823234 RepID=UPI003923D637